MVEGKIRFGMNAVKGVGVGAIEAIIRGARGRRAVRVGLYDFCARVDTQMANKRVLEALISGGAFDSTGDPRRGMLEALPLAMADGERRRKDEANGQGDLFGAAVAAEDSGHPRPDGAAVRVRPGDAAARPRRRPSACTSRRTRCRACATSCIDEIEVPGEPSRQRRRRAVMSGPAASSPTPRRR